MGSCSEGEWECGVAGPSEDETDAVSSEAKEGARLTVCTEEDIFIEEA